MTTTTPSRSLAIPYLGVLASLQMIDPTVANTALVQAGRSLQMHGATMALAASISTLAQAATVLLMGFLADRLGRRRVLITSLLLAAGGGVLAMSAPCDEVFLVGRAIAGVGMGSVLAAAFAAVRFVVRPEQLTQSLGLWNLVMVAGFIGGSLLGGVLADSSWRLALGLVPVLSLLCLLPLLALLPPMPANRALKADAPGLISIAAAMVLLLLGVSHAVGGLSAPAFWAPSLGGLALFAVHIAIEQRQSEPIFPVGLYARGCFAAAVVSGIGWNFAQSVVQLQTSNFWQVVQRYSTSQVALAQLPLLLCFGIGGMVAGTLMRPGRRTVQLMGGGSLVLVLGLGWLAGIRADSSYVSLLPSLVLVGLGLAFVAVPQSALFVQEAPARYFGAVTAFRTTSGQLGFALGFAASGAMANGFGFSNLRTRLFDAGVGPQAIPVLVNRVRTILSTGVLPAGSPKAFETVIHQAYASGLAGTMLVVATVVLLLSVISLLLLAIGLLQQRLESRAAA